MSVDEDLVEAAKIQLTRITCMSLGLVVLLAMTFLAREEDLPPPILSIGALLFGACLWGGILARSHPRLARLGFLVTLQFVLLAGPWWLDGIRRGLMLMEIPLILYASFLAGTRLASIFAGLYGLNVISLAWLENHGSRLSQISSPGEQVFFLVMACGFGLFLVAHSRGLIHKILATAKLHRSRQDEHRHKLSHGKSQLDRRIQEREKELTALRKRLTYSTEVLSSSYDPIVQRITVRARYIREVLQADDPASLFPVERILAGCDRLTRMHQALSRLSRLGPEGLRLVELDSEALHNLIRTIWDEIRLGYPRADHRLFFNELAPCHADPELLRQVWQHLLSNAAKFSARQPKPSIIIGHQKNEFYVHDNGVGFDVAMAQNLFELFNRQHRTEDFPGDGIGLASAKRILEIHAGSIRLESKPDQGTTVFFTLPPNPGTTLS